MNLRSNNVRAWMGSIIFHVFLALLFFFWQVDVTVSEPEFIEVSWGTVTNVSSVNPARPITAGVPKEAASTALPESRRMNLPERSIDLPDEVLRIPDAKKMDVDERPAPDKTMRAENLRGEKNRDMIAGIPGREKTETPGLGESVGEVPDTRAAGVLGGETGSPVSISMQWSDGGTRKKISGELPAYPPGVKVEAQIKIQAVVMPDGSIKSLKPAQKGHTLLEEEAMKKVRLWVFEELKRSSPQVDQTCVITFNFRLQ